MGAISNPPLLNKTIMTNQSPYSSLYYWEIYTRGRKYDFSEVLAREVPRMTLGERVLDYEDVVAYLTEELEAFKPLAHRDKKWILKNVGSRRYKALTRPKDYMANLRAKHKKTWTKIHFVQQGGSSAGVRCRADHERVVATMTTRWLGGDLPTESYGNEYGIDDEITELMRIDDEINPVV